jgi:tetratricopeptide (TPR) repeat protein
MWRCPEIKILRKPPAPEDNGTIVRRELAKRFSDRYIQAAMLDYWNGNGSEAAVLLEKVRDDMRKAPLHATADAMRKDISDADQLFKAGEGQLQQQDVDRAAIAFDEALQLDEKLMGNLATARPSFYRRNMEQDIAHQAFVNGKVWSDRGDARKACLLFKIGFRFYKADNDLNRAIGWCSSQGAAALAKGPGCGDMPWILDVAVDGDGLKEKVDQLKAAQKCR